MWRGREHSLRLTSEVQLRRLRPGQEDHLLLYNQMSDLTEVTFMAMAALAQDLYTRVPEGSREFEKLIEAVGLKFGSGAEDEIPVAK